MTIPEFVDVSTWQGAIDFHAYAAWARQWDGVARIALKTSEGVGFTDPRFITNRQAALAAGVEQIFYYHYAGSRFGNSPTDEAYWFLQVMKDILRPNDLVFLDFEENAVQATSDWAYAWLATVEDYYGGKLPGLYASSYYISQRLQDERLKKYPLWLANWQFTPDERPPVPAPWSSYFAVQYTDRATNVPGIATPVDANIFFGGNTVNNVIYGPNSADFDTWFVANDADHWTCKQTGFVVQFGNKSLFSQLSITGGTLPVIGLPRTNEIYQQKDGVSFSVQFFERGLIIYDPHRVYGGQPGFGDCYLGKYEQFKQYDPAYKPPAAVVGIPAELRANIDTNATLAATMQKIADGLPMI